MIVVNVVIGGFRWQDLKWLAYVTVQLQVSDYSQMSHYNFADLLIQNTAIYAPITFQEIVMVMISIGNRMGPSKIKD